MKKGTKVTGVYMGQPVTGEVYSANETTVWIEVGEMMCTCPIETVKEVKVSPEKKHVVINEGVSGSQYVTKVESGLFIKRDGLLIEITGTERITDKTVRIYGRYIDSGETYSENKRSHTIIHTYSRNNIRMAM